LQAQGVDLLSEAHGRRGVCPYAGAVVDAVACGGPWAGVVLTTTCDQMRYAASVLEHRGDPPVFLMNVPSTWQTATARSLYIEELRRLGRFFAGLGGKPPAHEELAEVMSRFDRARAQVRQARARLSARQFAEALMAVREDAAAVQPLLPPRGGRGGENSTLRDVGNACDRSPRPGLFPTERTRAGGPPLALVGGPLLPRDYDLLDWIERAGGRIVLDASEWGERTLPRPFDSQRRLCDPLEELADAYFGGIPDVFRRPNDPCYEYLRREMAARQVRGVVFRRYVWCDLWHAELPRLKARSPVPVLDLDVAQSEASAEGRTVGRVEAFLEMLNAAD
jgi:benzoyl-CoA reductase/2-hydroxyglutaryl-CoA dehydratase subunit BcrC/BadD/HgdB